MFKLNAKNIMAKEMTSGDGVSCSNDFALENNSAKDAEVFIILGGRPFSKVQIPQHGVKMYDLKKNLSIAKLNGKPVSMDDWAFVINSRDNTVPIMIHCTE